MRRSVHGIRCVGRSSFRSPLASVISAQFSARSDFVSWIDGRSLGIASLAFNVAAFAVLLCMPLRDPFWSTKEVSQPFTEPTSALRSPEDAMTLYQFMTVTWVTPLLSLARVRRLEDGDVWQLPYEFLHQRLHERFRETE